MRTVSGWGRDQHGDESHSNKGTQVHSWVFGTGCPDKLNGEPFRFPFPPTNMAYLSQTQTFEFKSIRPRGGGGVKARAVFDQKIPEALKVVFQRGGTLLVPATVAMGGEGTLEKRKVAEGRHNQRKQIRSMVVGGKFIHGGTVWVIGGGWIEGKQRTKDGGAAPIQKEFPEGSII